MNLAGYKTFILGFLVIILGQLGMHVAPNVIQAYGDVIFSVIGVLIVVLRVFTTTPIFARLETEAGFSAADAAQLKSEILAALPDTGTLSQAMTDLMAKIDALPAPTLSTPTLSTPTLPTPALSTAAAPVAPAPAPTADPALKPLFS